MKGKRGRGMEYSIALFIMMTAMLIILAPFTLRAMRDITSGIGTGIADISPMANATAQGVSTTVTSLWDFAVIFAFLILVIVLLISSYLVDIHPIFLIVYAILAFILFMIVPALNDAFVQMYAVPEMVNETNALSMTQYLGSHFGIIMFIIFIISGIIMFGKLRARGQAYG